MEASKLGSIDDISSHVRDGMSIAIGGVHSHNVPMSIVRQIVRLKTRDLTLLGSISAGLPMDLLVGAGCVREVIAPYVGMEMWGLAPNFRRAVEKKKIIAHDVCEAFPIYSLRASSNGIPFHPFPPGVHKYTDIHRNNPYYAEVEDPFSGDRVAAVRAFKPDMAIIHVQKASEDGNCIHLGSVVTDRLMATAAEFVIVTCDELVSKDEIIKSRDLVTIPGFFVDLVIPLKRAAYPTSSHGMYPYDRAEILKYLKACREDETYKSYIHEFVSQYEPAYLIAQPITQVDDTVFSDTVPYTRAELVAVIFARDIRDGEFGICGAVSDIPMAAMQLAERMNVNLRWIAGGSGYVNPRGYLAPSSTDYQMSSGAESRLSMDEVIPIEMEELDFFFAGGLQIDGRGNTNLAGIPSGGGWKLRGPGSVGLAFLSRAKRVYLYSMTHNSRTLVDRVSYISGAGHPDGGNPHGGGPTLLVTDKCVFSWNEDQWHLKSVHEGVTVDEVRENTGFAFTCDDPVATTLSPTEEELGILRQIDEYGYLRGKRS